jgi:MYXO-CTERM domain-containing protein
MWSRLDSTNASRVVAAVLVGLIAPSAFAGPDWDGDLEVDAGKSIQTAQTITFNGNLQTIAGKLTGSALTLEPDFHDVYKFVITDPGKFIVDLTGVGGANFDACLWLFDANGVPLLGTNDANSKTNAPRLTSTANGGNLISVTSPGIYFLAVSGFASEPVSFGKPLWPGVVFDPGIVAGSFQNKFAWEGDWSGDGAIGDYILTVTGVAGVPAPGAAALFALAGLAGRRRRVA